MSDGYLFPYFVNGFYFIWSGTLGLLIKSFGSWEWCSCINAACLSDHSLCIIHVVTLIFLLPVFYCTTLSLFHGLICGCIWVSCLLQWDWESVPGHPGCHGDRNPELPKKKNVVSVALHMLLFFRGYFTDSL